ncbi:unnamed protein product [Ixodes pacificus]
MNWAIFCSFMQSYSYMILMCVECFLCPEGLRMWSQLKKCQNVLSGSMLQFHWCHDASMGKACQEVKLLLLESIHSLLLHIVFQDIVSAQNGSLAKLTDCFNCSAKLVLQAVVAFKCACSADKFGWSLQSCSVEIFFPY